MTTFRHRIPALLISIGLLASLVAGCRTPQIQKTTPIAPPQGHAHNDYEHPRPLLDALDQGFRSVEADIHLVGDALLVAHDPDEVDPNRTLQGLYLDPLAERLRAPGQTLATEQRPFILLIDLKTSAQPTYAQLERVLRDYRDILTTYKDRAKFHGLLSVIISGARPIDYVRQQSYRMVGIDGRLGDLEQPDLSAMYYPMISDNWRIHFQWRGDGPFPESDKMKLQSLVAQAHAKGCLLRFWANPDIPEYWQLAQDMGVDLINTDRLEAFSEFYNDSPNR